MKINGLYETEMQKFKVSLSETVMYTISALILAALCGCASPKVLLSEKESGVKIIPLAKGETAQISVTENPTTGYLWYHTVSNDVLKVTKSDYLPPDMALCGAPGVRQITLKAEKAGKGVLQLRSRRPWVAASKEDTLLTYTFEVR